MRYDISKNSYVVVNLIEGNKQLTYNQLYDFVINNFANISLSGTDVLVVEFDLGDRVFVDEARYYFSSVFDQEVVMSGISFWARRSEHENYSYLQTLVGSGYYYTLFSGSLYAPQYIKLVHTLSGSLISGSANFFQILNNDAIVNFGIDGQKAFERFDLSLLFDHEDIKEVAIFNGGSVSADAYISFEPQNSIIDEILSLSTTASGPWLKVFEDQDMICGPQRFNSYYLPEFNLRQFNNTFVTSDNFVELTPGLASGTYTTCIFGNPDSTFLFRPLLLEADFVTGLSGVVFYDNFDSGLLSNWIVLTGSATAQDFYLAANNSSLRTKNSIFYWYNWEFTAKIFWAHSTTVYFYVFYLSNLYACVILRSNYYDGFIKFTLNNVDIYNSGSRYWYDNANVWHWLKVKKEFGFLRFKLWNVSAPEPDWWFSYAVEISVLPKDGYIMFNGLSGFRVDDVMVVNFFNPIHEMDGKISVGADDLMPTIELRSSDKLPVSYHMYTSMVGESPIVCRLNYFDTGDIITSYDINNSSSGRAFCQVCDHSDETIWSLIVNKDPYYTNPRLILNRFVRRTNSSSSSVIASLFKDSTFNIKFFVPNWHFGCWVYYDCQDLGGFNLRFFSENLTSSFGLQETRVDFVSGMCLALQGSVDGALWYGNSVHGAIFKIDKTGQVLAHYDVVGDIGALCSDNQGGCYFFSSGSIVRLNRDAKVVYTLSLGANVKRMDLDKDVVGNFWLLVDGTTLINMNYDGVYQFVYSDLTANITDMRVVSGGVWLKFANLFAWCFFDRDSKSITKNLPAAVDISGVLFLDNMNVPAFFSKKFREEDFDNRFPLPHDSYWINLPWRKISVNNYLLPSKSYHQVRFTLRAASGYSSSPILKRFYLQKVLKLENIPAGSSKFIYIKANISFLTESQLGMYISNLKVWWYIPE